MWRAREYQSLAFNRVAMGIRRLFLGWHRRAGKDNFALQLAKREAERVVGTYWHLFPVQAQARKAIWRGMDNNGVNFVDQAFPKHERTGTIDRETLIQLPNGSTWQMGGSDKYDQMVGANVRGIIFSEWALCDPAAWDYFLPMLIENGGWACFITTFRGRNHAWQMAQRNLRSPHWYVDIRDITQTRRGVTEANAGQAVVTLADIERERQQGYSEAMIQQEFYCNPTAANEHAYFGQVLPQILEAA